MIPRASGPGGTIDRSEADNLEKHFTAVAEGFRAAREDLGDVKRYVGVVAESLRSDIRLLAEGHVAFGQGLENVRHDVAGLGD